MTVRESPTERFTATFGVNPGYGHENEVDMNSDAFAILWDSAQNGRSIYVPAVIFPATVMYNRLYGCPLGGEDIFVVHGVRNPDFYPDYEEWRLAVLRSVETVKEQLEQSTAQVVFDRVEAVYYTSSSLFGPAQDTT